MSQKYYIILVIFLFTDLLICAQSFDEKTIDIGNIGVTLTNVGTIGRPNVRNDPQGPPSMEYPINSGIEHLFESGLWIGAVVDGQTVVSTAAVDAPTGYTTGSAGFEFTAEVGSSIQQRSSLTNSDYFSLSAVSHQDMLMDFSDKNTIIPGSSILIADHDNPLNAQVHLETYAWNFSFADFFVILNYEITNESTAVWDSVYLGLWTDMIVRNVNVATDNGVAFFNKTGGGYLEEELALYTFDVNGDPGFTESYSAIQFLGVEWRDQFIHPSNIASITAAGYPEPSVNANFWNFRTFDGTDFSAPFTIDQNFDELQAYQKMKSGLNFNLPSISESVAEASNRTQLTSIGPLVSLMPGEKVTFALAMVCAKQLPTGGVTGPEKDTEFARTELKEHLGWSRRTYNGEDVNENGLLDAGEDLNGNESLDRFILPEPPADPPIKIIPASQSVEIYWSDLAESSIDPISKEMDFEGYRIYRSHPGDDQGTDLIGSATLIQQWDIPDNSTGFNNGFSAIRLDEPINFPGDPNTYHYKYINDNLLNGWQYLYIITSFDRGDEALGLESLESSLVANAHRVIPGTNGTSDADTEIGVYPNPYKLSAAWDGNTAVTKKIHFFNLPDQCSIRIYTLAGDIITELDHDSDTYQGDDIAWYSNYAGASGDRIFSGGEHAWDILSESNQTITQGLYLFTVKDHSTGKIKKGKFAVLK